MRTRAPAGDQEQRETEADSVAYCVLAALGFDISSSSVEDVAGWNDGNADVLREAADTVHQVATAVLAELEARGDPQSGHGARGLRFRGHSGGVGCIFCELIASGSAEWVLRDRDVVAFLPLPASRLAPGHVLVVPRSHCVGVLDADPGVLTAVALVQRVGQAMQTSLHAGGVVVLNASGPDSGQSVDHLDFHVVPCWRDDRADFWPTDRSHHVIEGDSRVVLEHALAIAT